MTFEKYFVLQRYALFSNLRKKNGKKISIFHISLPLKTLPTKIFPPTSLVPPLLTVIFHPPKTEIRPPALPKNTPHNINDPHTGTKAFPRILRTLHKRPPPQHTPASGRLHYVCFICFLFCFYLFFSLFMQAK